ncbi:hypothetical protein BH23VER1_BH23VER1_20260 [soil metagenome]
MPSSVARSPYLRLHPGFDGRFDYSLMGVGERPLSRLTMSLGGATIPALYADLFEDSFADGRALEDQFLDWFVAALPMPDCRIALAGGEARLVSNEIVSGCRARLTLDLDGGRVVRAQRVEIGEGGQIRECGFVPLGESLVFLLAAQKLGRVGNAAVHRFGGVGVADGLPPSWAATPVFQPAAPTILSVADFNALGTRLSESHTLAITFAVGGSPVQPEPANPAVAISLGTEPLSGEGLVRVSAPEAAIEEVFARIREVAEGFSRLLAAGSRRLAVGALIWAILREHDPESRSTLVSNGLLRDSSFSEHWQTREAAQFLGAVGDRFAHERWLEPVATMNPPGWLVREPVGFARTVAALAIIHAHLEIPFDPAERRAARGFEIRTPAGAIAARIPLLYAEATGAGVELTIDALPVAAASLEVAMVSGAHPDTACDDRFGHAEKIDWFELRPEVRCAGFVLSESEWNAILTTGTFQRSPGGAVVVIGAESMDKLRKLRDSVALIRERRATPRRPAAADFRDDIRYGRLAVLDWLSLSRAGVELRLKPADQRILDALLGGPLPEHVPLPRFINADLRAYQKHGVRWMTFLYQLRFGAVLADDMGLGKTLQTITFLAGIRENRASGDTAGENTAGGDTPGGDTAGDDPDARPHLVVLPPTLVFNWESELRRFYPRFRLCIYTGERRDSRQFASADIVLTTYDIVRRDIALLKKRKFDVAVFDEAQTVKNYRSSRARAARQIQATFRLCLTGTPVENHLGEYFSIIDLALPRLLGEYRDFTEAVKNNPDAPQLRRALPFVLRRKKEGLLTELPPLVESDVYLELSDFQKELYTRTVAEVREEVAQAYATKPAGQAGIAALAALNRLRLACIDPLLIAPGSREVGPKLDYLRSTLQEIVEEGHAALVFSQFTRALDLVGIQLRAAGLAFLRLDGKTPTQERGGLVQRFQSASGPPVFLISLRTGGAGLNLTRATYVFHLDPWWNPAVEDQATARTHRFGQQNSVTLQRLLMRHTVEEKMVELKARKKSLYTAIMDAAEAQSASTSPLDPAQLTALLC